jgi:small-conductance mechanosensitive channel
MSTVIGYFSLTRKASLRLIFVPVLYMRWIFCSYLQQYEPISVLRQAVNRALHKTGEPQSDKKISSVS